MRISKLVLSGMSALILVTSAYSADAQGVEQLEQQLIEKESALLQSELKMDEVIQQNWEFRGIRGWIHSWFNRSEKRAVEASMEELEQKINALHHESLDMERSIQSEVFNVGLSFEKRGEFEKAIEFYRKVIDKDDKVKSHIGKCYQALGNTAGAVDWFLKMTQSDENYLFIVDAYWEGKQPKEATDWLFRILESFRNNDAENKALKLLEQYDYPDRANDFPGYHSRLSSVYVKKALILFNKNETDSIHAYRKAVELIAINGNLDGASSAIVNDYHKAVMDAENTLRAKQQEAHERYQSMLNRAEQAMRDAEQRYNRALRDAYRDYDWALLQARDEFGRARKALENLRHNIQNTVEYQEQVRRAEARMRMADEKYNHLVHHKEEFVRNEVYYERGQVAESREEYHRVVNSRERIIREYVEPYERRLEYTRNEEYMIKSLHSKIYG